MTEARWLEDPPWSKTVTLMPSKEGEPPVFTALIDGKWRPIRFAADGVVELLPVGKSVVRDLEDPTPL